MTATSQLEDIALRDALLRRNFFSFTWKVFDTLMAGSSEQFEPNWHVRALCHRLNEVRLGTIPRLVVTVPPRHLKSIATSVALPAFLLGHDPSCKMLIASYALELARKHSDDCRIIMESDWYRRIFPHTRIRSARGEELLTTSGGIRKAVSTGGVVTGFGAHYIIIDDLLKAQDASSETERLRAQTYIEQGLLTRFDNPAQGRVIAIQQRLHEDDPAGFLLAKGTYQHLDLPAIAPEDTDIPIGDGLTHRRKAGEPLFPQRFDLEVLDRMRRELGSAAFEMQYQQNPIAAGGSALRWDWFGTHDELPFRERFELIVQSWDTGMSAAPTSDWSVCTIWGLREDRWYLLHVDRFRKDFPELRSTILHQQRFWQADKVLIEKAGNGMPLLQGFRRDRHIFTPILPKLDKEVRFNAALAPIEAGEVLLPREADWLTEFRRELLGFPRAKYDDQVDSVSQFLNWTRNRFGPPRPRRERINIGNR